MISSIWLTLTSLKKQVQQKPRSSSIRWREITTDTSQSMPLEINTNVPLMVPWPLTKLQATLLMPILRLLIQSDLDLPLTFQFSTMKYLMTQPKHVPSLNRLLTMLLLILNQSKKTNTRMPQQLCNLLEIT